ncbi:MAG: hypothetical protein F4020_06985 [Gammaproteobacteria bacterium]|nr:hypothetical protein [Gammaproteobacteria bacterium]MYK69273.1 hypothetical protein [Gammaproteobacteria bacterium]
MASHSTFRPYGEPLGVRLVDSLQSAGLDLFSSADAHGEAGQLGLSRGHVSKLLHQLTEARRLTRVKRGLYAINDAVTRSPRVHPFAIGTSLVTPSAISHWSALQHWGLTEQVPGAVTLSSPRRTFLPTGQVEATHGLRARVVAETRYQVVSIVESRFFAVTDVWMDERSRVSVLDRERALLDAFQHFHVFGSLSVGLGILDDHLHDLDVDRLVHHAIRLDIGAVAKRLGWALERLQVPERALKPLLTHPVKGDTPLEPGRPARGHHDRRWQVIENLATR